MQLFFFLVCFVLFLSLMVFFLNIRHDGGMGSRDFGEGGGIKEK